MDRLEFFGNFFTEFYILNHQAKNLDERDRTTSLIYSIAIGVFSFGMVPLICLAIAAASNKIPDSVDDKMKDVANQTGLTSQETKKGAEKGSGAKKNEERPLSAVEIHKLPLVDKFIKLCEEMEADRRCEGLLHSLVNVVLQKKIAWKDLKNIIEEVYENDKNLEKISKIVSDSIDTQDELELNKLFNRMNTKERNSIYIAVKNKLQNLSSWDTPLPI